MTVTDIVSNLRTNFEKYGNISGTGPTKQHTIKMYGEFFNAVCDRAVDNKNLKIKNQYNVIINSPFSMNLDKAVIDSKNKLKAHLEEKAYGDIDMLKRFAADSHCLLKCYPNIINIGLCIQPATPSDTTINMSRCFDIKHGVNFHLLYLTEQDRQYKKDKKFLSTYDEQYLIDRTQLMIDKLSGLL